MSIALEQLQGYFDSDISTLFDNEKLYLCQIISHLENIGVENNIRCFEIPYIELMIFYWSKNSFFSRLISNRNASFFTRDTCYKNIKSLYHVYKHEQDAVPVVFQEGKLIDHIFFGRQGTYSAQTYNNPQVGDEISFYGKQARVTYSGFFTIDISL